MTKERSGKNGDHPQAWTVLAAKEKKDVLVQVAALSSYASIHRS